MTILLMILFCILYLVGWFAFWVWKIRSMDSRYKHKLHDFM